MRHRVPSFAGNAFRKAARMSRLVLPLVLALLVPGVGCVATDRPDAPGEPLVLVDSVILREADSIVVGEPSGLAVDGQGTIYVSDAHAGRIIRFDSAGRALGTIGRKGSGPGELGAPGVLSLAGDSLLIVVDLARRRPYAYSTQDGSFRRSGRSLGVPVPILSAVAHGDDVWIGFLDPARHTPLARWDLRTDSLSHVGTLPREYHGTRLEYWQPVSLVLSWADSLLLGFSGHPDVFLLDARMNVLDTLVVPLRARRGVPRDLEEIYAREGIGENEVSILSILTGMHRLSSGSVALVYLDITPGGDAWRTLSTASFLTLSTLDGRRACVDLVLPAVDDGRPVFAFRADTLFMVHQRVTGDARAELLLRRYALDDRGCGPVR